ncbi:MAG: hypothetical protein NVSMB62_24730 [Acidobacteriaceae bacterium]
MQQLLFYWLDRGMVAQVVIYGKDPTLLTIRALVLECAGVESIRCLVEDAAEPLDLVRSRLNVLCSSIAYREQERVAARIKACWEKAEVLMIRANGDGMQQDGSGAYVCGIHPKEIVASCRKILQLDA